MIYLCYLAAGSSHRFGSNKLLYNYHGKPLWRYGYEVLKSLRLSEPCELHVASRFDEILEFSGPEGVFATDSEKGLSFTIKAVCASCVNVSPKDRLLFLVADQPLITRETVERLLSVPLSSDINDGLPLAACVTDGNRSGNPVCFSGLCLPELLKLTGDRGGKALFSSFPERIAYVLCEPEELKDIDYREDT